MDLALPLFAIIALVAVAIMSSRRRDKPPRTPMPRVPPSPPKRRDTYDEALKDLLDEVGGKRNVPEPTAQTGTPARLPTPAPTGAAQRRSPPKPRKPRPRPPQPHKAALSQ